MKKILLLLIIIGTFALSVPLPTNAQLECDQCGYCVGREKPGNWEACATCLYKDPTATLSTRETIPGKFYTQLGCIDTGITKTNADNNIGAGLNTSVTGSLANFLLNKLLFPIAGTLGFLYIIYGAYLLMTSQDDPERKLQGRGTITGAIVGIIFTLLSVFLVNFIAADVLKIPGFYKGSAIQIQAYGSTATIGGAIVNPIIGIQLDGKLISQKTVQTNIQTITINLPSRLDPTNPTDLSRLSFGLINDACYSASASRHPPLCCDPSLNIPQAKRDQCNDRTNYNGDINIKMQSLFINGKECLTYSYPKSGAYLNMNSNFFISCTAVAN